MPCSKELTVPLVISRSPLVRPVALGEKAIRTLNSPPTSVLELGSPLGLSRSRRVMVCACAVPANSTMKASSSSANAM